MKSTQQLFNTDTQENVTDTLKLFWRWNLQNVRYKPAVIWTSEVIILYCYELAGTMSASYLHTIRNENCGPPAKVACRTSNWTGLQSASVSWCWRGWSEAASIALHTLRVRLVAFHLVIATSYWQPEAQSTAAYWTVCCTHRCVLMWAMWWYSHGWLFKHCRMWGKICLAPTDGSAGWGLVSSVLLTMVPSALPSPFIFLAKICVE